MQSEEELRYRLAVYAHEAWSGWMKCMFSKSGNMLSGGVIVPAKLVERWTRQMNTIYDELPANENASDLQEANKMIAIMKEVQDKYTIPDDMLYIVPCQEVEIEKTKKIKRKVLIAAIKKYFDGADTEELFSIAEDLRKEI